MAIRAAGLGRIGKQPRPFQTHMLHARFHQLDAHEHGEQDRDEADNACGKQIKDTDILVVGGHEPTGKEPLFGVVVMAMDGGICHRDLLFQLSSGAGRACGSETVLVGMF